MIVQKINYQNNSNYNFYELKLYIVVQRAN
jgi:hypothetical protein